MLIRPLQFRNVAFSRALGLLLLAFILYGTTVEAGHRHGRTLTTNSGGTSLSLEEKSGNLSGPQTGCNDCLICQLHQGFATTLITLRVNDPPIRVLHQPAAVVVPDLLSRIISPLAGRAPPFIS